MISRTLVHTFLLLQQQESLVLEEGKLSLYWRRACFFLWSYMDFFVKTTWLDQQSFYLMEDYSVTVQLQLRKKIRSASCWILQEISRLWLKVSDNPEDRCHFVPLGLDAVKVWIDIVKVTNAEVWRASTEIECMGDAIGSAIAWPKDKVSLC